MGTEVAAASEAPGNHAPRPPPLPPQRRRAQKFSICAARHCGERGIGVALNRVGVLGKGCPSRGQDGRIRSCAGGGGVHLSLFGQGATMASNRPRGATIITRTSSGPFSKVLQSDHNRVAVRRRTPRFCLAPPCFRAAMCAASRLTMHHPSWPTGLHVRIWKPRRDRREPRRSCIEGRWIISAAYIGCRHFGLGDQ